MLAGCGDGGAMQPAFFVVLTPYDYETIPAGLDEGSYRAGDVRFA